MFEKLVRFCRSNCDKEESEAAHRPKIAMPKVAVRDTTGVSGAAETPEPVLRIPENLDGVVDDAGDDTDSAAPVFHISKGCRPQDTLAQERSARSGNDPVASADSRDGPEAAREAQPEPEPERNAAHTTAPAPEAAATRGGDAERERRGARTGNKLPAVLGGRAVKEHHAPEESPNSMFTAYANPRLWRNTERSLSYVGEVTKLNREVFTPTRPKLTLREFIGRTEFVETIVQSIEEERAHVVLFGHKSVGKTSVLNIISESASDAGYLVARVRCSADLTFETLIRTVFDELSTHLAKAPAGATLEKQLGVERLSDLIEGEIADVPAALRVFNRISPHQVIILLDDFHRIRDAGFKTKIREFMSALSDKGAWVSIVLAGQGGISSTFEFLQGDAPSGTVIFELGLMKPDEIATVVEKGGARLGIQFDDEVMGAIIQLTQGLPVVVQWLGLLTARRALRNYVENVTMDDLIEVSDEVSMKISQKLSGMLDKLQSNGRHSWANDLLFLAARTPIREDGIFSTSDMSHESRRAVGKTFSELNLHRVMTQFCDGVEEPILEKIATADGVRYRFADPMMRAVVMLRNARRLDATYAGMLGGMSRLDELPSPGAA